MRDFLKDAKWFVFSIIVIAGLWFGPQVSDYLDELERERLYEERRLVNEEKEAKRKKLEQEEKAAELKEAELKEAEVSNFNFSESEEYRTFMKEEFYTGLVCDGHEKYYPIRIILKSIEGLDDPTELKYIKPILDEITRTISYEIVRERFQVFPKKITFYGDHLYKKFPPDSIYKMRYNYRSQISSDEVFSLNRESLELVIVSYDDRYKLQCSKVDASIIEEYVLNHNESILSKNIL